MIGLNNNVYFICIGNGKDSRITFQIYSLRSSRVIVDSANTFFPFVFTKIPSSSNFLNAGYFTTSSFYSIRDAHTEEEVIPFDDNCTKLSADSEGMYFKLYMKGLQPERYYRLLFKHINDDGIEIFDNNYHFKVVR